MSVPMSVMMVMVVIVCVIVSRANPLHVVVVAFLHQPHLILEAKHLRAILATATVHRVVTGQYLLNPFLEGFDKQRVVVQIRCLDELNFRVPCSHAIGVFVNARDEHAGEQEIGEHDDPFEPEAGGVFQTRLDKGKGNARIDGFAPTEAEPFPQQAHNLRDIPVRVGVRRATADNDKQGLFAGNVIRRAVKRFLDACAGGPDHLWIDPELLAEVDGHAVILRGVGIQNRRDVVLHVTCSKQHARYGKHPRDALIAQFVEPVANDRRRELEIAILDRRIRHQFAQAFRNLRELAYGPFITAAMAADHDANLFCHRSAPPPRFRAADGARREHSHDGRERTGGQDIAEPVVMSVALVGNVSRMGERLRAGDGQYQNKSRNTCNHVSLLLFRDHAIHVRRQRPQTGSVARMQLRTWPPDWVSRTGIAFSS